MRRPRSPEVAAVCLLFLLLLSSPEAMAITLPAPPDRSAPANNQSGPLQSTSGQSFSGGVVLVKDSSVNQNLSSNEFIVDFFCVTSSVDLTKHYRSEIGESISGPVTSDQASGIVQAMKSVAPPKDVPLRISLSGIYGGNITYSVTGVTYNVTTYSVWVPSQQSQGADQRVGYIVSGVPERPLIGRTNSDLAGAFCPEIGYERLGAGFGSDPWSWLTKPFTSPPENGVAPFITFGTVRVLSSSGVAGIAHMRSGENATFLLPPGTYQAQEDVVLFGIPLSVGGGTFSSPNGAEAAQFTVSLTSAESLWYALEAVALVVLVAAVLFVALKVHLWSAIVRASANVPRLLRSAWEALTRVSPGDAVSGEADPEVRASLRRRAVEPYLEATRTGRQTL